LKDAHYSSIRKIRMIVLLGQGEGDAIASVSSSGTEELVSHCGKKALVIGLLRKKKGSSLTE